MKPPKADLSRSKPTVKISVWIAEAPRQQSRGGCLTLAAFAIVGLLGWGSWVAVLLIVNPGSVRWLSALIPQWGEYSIADSSQTLAEIEAEAKQMGLTVGNPIQLPSTSQKRADFLLPILAPQSRCPSASTGSACTQIVEVRVYHPQAATLSLVRPQARFELLDRLKVTGPEELMAIAPLTHAKLTSQGSSRKLPLTTLTLFEGKAPQPGVWLSLSGQWRRGSTSVVYGQMVHYDPLHQRLQILLPWTSPAGRLPEWRQVTGSAIAELIVDQTIGLEPQFQLYQVQLPEAPGRPIRLEAVALNEANLTHQHYTRGLLLARHGLWSSALSLLQSAKRNSDRWSATAQAQLDLVALHAQVTQAQAARNWASPTQQIAALLMDGQWSKALALLRSAHQDGYDINSLLTANANPLWKRVEAALQTNANQPDVQQWGALTLAVQRDRSAAITWLQKRSANPTLQKVLALLDPLPNQEPNLQRELAQAPPSSATASRLMGTITPLATIQPQDWLSLDPNRRLTLPANQSWYQIQVIGLQDGAQWRSAPFSDLRLANSTPQAVSALWQRLALGQTIPLQVWSGAENLSSQSVQVTIRALQRQGDQLQLLATGDRLSLTSTGGLAVTAATLHWVNPLMTLTLTELHQQQPQEAIALATGLEQELQAAGQTLPAAISATPMTAASQPKTGHPLTQVGHWMVDRIELTGEGQPESMITLTTDASSSARSLIFSSTGQLIYSDLQIPDQSLITVADLGNGTPPVLILRQGQRHSLRQWSASRQQFVP